MATPTYEFWVFLIVLFLATVMLLAFFGWKNINFLDTYLGADVFISVCRKFEHHSWEVRALKDLDSNIPDVKIYDDVTREVLGVAIWCETFDEAKKTGQRVAHELNLEFRYHES